jgi:hypothetical protein
MNKLKKTFILPILAVSIIILMTSLMWLLTAFFSLIFQCTIAEVAASPMILIYIFFTIGTIYMILESFKYVDEKL